MRWPHEKLCVETGDIVEDAFESIGFFFHVDPWQKFLSGLDTRRCCGFS